jgi:hypothetical protein
LLHAPWRAIRGNRTADIDPRRRELVSSPAAERALAALLIVGGAALAGSNGRTGTSAG